MDQTNCIRPESAGELKENSSHMSHLISSKESHWAVSFLTYHSVLLFLVLLTGKALIIFPKYFLFFFGKSSKTLTNGSSLRRPLKQRIRKIYRRGKRAVAYTIQNKWVGLVIDSKDKNENIYLFWQKLKKIHPPPTKYTDHTFIIYNISFILYSTVSKTKSRALHQTFLI